MPDSWKAARTARVLAAAVAFGLFAAAVDAAPGPVPHVAHVVMIVFENHERDSVIGNPLAPTFTALARRYAQATNYQAVAHPSLPNYLALVSGSTHGVKNDCTDCVQRGPTIGSQLTQAGISWGAYAEGFPTSPLFAKKHVPFLYFPGQDTFVHPLTDFDPKHLPAFSFVVPDMCHDMHDCSTPVADRWLKEFVQPLLTLKRTVIFIVFDEGTTAVGGGGNVSMIAAGTSIRAHATYGSRANHYNLLRTVEETLGVSPLGRAAAAKPITGIWR
jgi:phospholipase C